MAPVVWVEGSRHIPNLRLTRSTGHKFAACGDGQMADFEDADRVPDLWVDV